MADRRTFNVVVLGLGFLFIFTAFTTCGNIEVSRVPVIFPPSVQNSFPAASYLLLKVFRGCRSQEFYSLNPFLISLASVLLSSSCLRRLMMNQYSPTLHVFALFIQ